MKRIAHLSDPHFGAADSTIAAAVLEEIHNSPPDLTILSGDLTMRARRKEIAAARDFLDQLPSPKLVIPGNHDMPGYHQPWERLTDPFRRYRNAFSENLEPELQHDGIHVVSLNSSRAWGFYADWSEGRLGRRQLVKMKHAFARETSAEYRILVIHHPLVELQVPGRAVIKPLAALLEQLQQSHVDFVLCGHFHRSIILPVGLHGLWHTVISQAPTVCSTRLQGEPQGYHEIHLDSDHAEIHHRVYDGKSFPVRSIHAFQREENGWSQTRLVS